MNYKRIITGFFAAAAALCSVGCADDGEVVDFETELNLSFVSYTANKSGGSQVLTIESNDKWSITDTNDLDWYSLSATAGEGDGEITISVDANTTVDSREAIFNIASGEVSIDFTLAQVAGDEVLSLSPASLLEVLKSGAKETISVESNSTWSAVAVFGADEQAWFELSGSYTDVVGNGELSVVIDQNDVAESRSAYILFTGSEGASVELQITQSDADPTLELSSTVENATVAATVTSFELNVESNTTWTIAEETEDWISPSVYTGTGDATVTVNLSANTLAEARSYTLTATYEGLETPVEYTITQAAAASTISIDPTAALSLTSAGGSQEYTVTCNDTWTVEIPEAATWLSYELTEGGFKLTVAENTDYTTTNAYTATVKVVCDSDTEEYAEISVAQSTPAAEELFSVAIEGSETLSVAFAADQTTAESFKIAVTSYVSSYDVKTVATVSGDDLTWLTGEPTTNTAATATEYTMTAASNGELESRGATITFTAKDPNGGDDIVAVVTVTQKGSGVTQPTTTASSTVDLANTASSTSAAIDITTNDTWSVSIPAAAADWLQTADVTASSFKFETKTANTTLTAKTATVTVACDNDEDMKLEFTVTQAAGDLYFTFDGDSTDAKSVAFDADGSSSDNVITISTNDTYTVEATDNSSNWLTWDTTTAGKITFTVAANTGVSELSSVVTLKSDSDLNTTLTINVSQGAVSMVVGTEAVAFDLFGYSADATVAVTVDTTTEWEITSISNVAGTEGWLTITDGSGATLAAGSKVTGSADITLAASINGTGGVDMSTGTITATLAAEERSATVTLSQGSITKTITVTQNSTDAPLFSPTTNSALPDSAGYSAEGGTFTAEFTGTSFYTLKEWCSWYSLSATHSIITHSDGITCVGSGTVTLTMDANPNSVMRGGYGQHTYDGTDYKGPIFAFSDYSTSYTFGQIYPYQMAGDVKFVVTDPTKTTFDDISATSGTFNVESNISWAATSSADWLTLGDTSSYTTDGIYNKADYAFNISENTSGSSRTAKITLTPNATTYAGTDRTDITLPEAVEISITQTATLADASATAFVSSTDTNTVTLTVDTSSFSAGQTFSASEFALNYTNSYAGSVAGYVSASSSASGSIAISSIALDADDATKMVITTSDSVYNTDALTLTYSGSGLALASGASFPASLTFEPSYVEYLNSDFQAAGDDQYYVSENAIGRTNALTMLDGSTSETSSYYSNLFTTGTNTSSYCFYNEGTDNTSAACLVLCSDPFAADKLGAEVLTVKIKVCVLTSEIESYQTVRSGFGVGFNAYDSNQTQPGYNSWGETYNWQNIGYTETSSNFDTWYQLTGTVSLKDGYEDIAYDNMCLTVRYNTFKHAAMFDDIYLGNAVPRP